MSNGQKQDELQGMDPFGQFLAAAYLAGRVPGDQTSAYNTVLDLLSPGAMAGRMEAGTPNVVSQFENMFGGVPMLPDEQIQLMRQQSGLQLSPVEQTGFDVERYQALADYLGKIAQSKAEMTRAEAEGRKAGVGEREVSLEERLFGTTQAKGEAEARLTGAQAGEIEAGIPGIANMLQAQTELAFSEAAQARAEAEEARRVSLDEQKKLLDLNIGSLSMYGLPWDPQIGGPDATATPDPQLKETAMKLKGVQTEDPAGFTAISALLRQGDIEGKDAAYAMLQRLYPNVFSLEEVDGWFSSPHLELKVNTSGAAGTQLFGDVLNPTPTPAPVDPALVAPPPPMGDLTMSPADIVEAMESAKQMLEAGTISQEYYNNAIKILKEQTPR